MAEAKRLHTPEGTPPSHRTLVAPHHSQGVLHTLLCLYQCEDLCDYSIMAEGQAFRVHRNVLAAVSDYFRVMLTGTMLESRQDFVELKGVTANAVKLLLDFAYTGKLVLTLDDSVEILAGACHLQIRSAIELCSEFLLGEIATKTCVDILNISEMFALINVKNYAIDYIVTHFEKIADTDQFYKIHRDHLIEILTSNSLWSSSELAVFHCVTKWIDFDRQERTVDAVNIFKHVRFALMKPEELVDQVSQTHVMSVSSECRALLDEALHYHVLPSRHPMMQTERTQIRNKPCMVAFGGRYGLNIGYKHNCNKMFVLHEGKWYPLQNTESNFLYAAVAVVDNFMYVCGGMGKPAHARTSLQRFDPRTGTWTRLAHMKMRRQSFPLVAHNGYLYAFGGGTPLEQSFEHPPSEKCEVYSIERNEWRSIRPLPDKRKSASACEYGSSIYVSGGRTDSETASTFWCYDSVKDLWTNKTPMLVSHAGHAMMSVNDTIFVIDRINLGIECYDIAREQWSKISPPCVSPLSGVARPSVMGPWVYFFSFVEENQDYLCKRYNVVTLETEELPQYPENVHCIISAPLTVDREWLSDTNNNNNNNNNSQNNDDSVNTTTNTSVIV